LLLWQPTSRLIEGDVSSDVATLRAHMTCKVA
jgi:hypothetical protein